MTAQTHSSVIVETLARELGVSQAQVEATIRLLDEGNTVPFIARYRKEVTGGLDDSQLRTLETRLTYLRELEERKATVLAAIEEQGKLTDELRALIEECDTKARLEDLYLPYKKRRKTKADMARQAGIEALVDAIFDDFSLAPATKAQEFVTEGFEDVKAVLDGARAIVTDRLSMNADLVGEIREKVWAQGQLRAAVVEGKEQEGEKYRDYFDYEGQLKNLPSHRVLAMLRAEREGILTLDVEPGPDEEYTELIEDRTDLWGGKAVPVTAATEWIRSAVNWAWRTKLQVSASLDSRMRLKEAAEQKAVEVFATNLKDVLMAAPAGHKATLGLDPGYRNGVKCAAVDATGKVVATTIVYPHQPQNHWTQAASELAALCMKHDIDLMAVGNGTASRETDKLAREVADMVEEAGGKRPIPVVVSESGASVYSASELAAQEFPDMDVSLRGAVSIARRLQDPLAELVKVDPKSIGVGQYQHDVNQHMLSTTLDNVVEDVVNKVGVNLNTASVPLLTRVAGVTPTLAKNIVDYRDANGAFANRKGLLKVPRLGPKAFEQCAGFLRIQGGDQPLDASAVHPESYDVVDQIASHTGHAVDTLIGNTAVLEKVRPSDYVTETIGLPTVKDILSELVKPGRDPRPSFTTAKLKEGVTEISDLTPGMVLEGTVTNVAAFGAFVDIGVHQDGLVHVSAMANHFVSDPHTVVHSGQVVKVKVVDVDVARHRIALSMRLNDEAGGVNSGKPNGADKPRSGKPRSQGRRRDSAPSGGSLADALRKAGFGK